MTSRRFITSRARSSLSELMFQAEERFGPLAAQCIEDDFRRCFAQLLSYPGSGHLRQDLTPDPTIRFWPLWPTLIAYREVEEGILILLVARGEADWTRLLEAQRREPQDRESVQG